MKNKELIDVLLELRSASMQLGTHPTECEVKALMRKYNLLFLGEKINHIYSNELCHALKNYFHLETDNDELISLLPDACKFLNMEYIPLVEVSKLGKTSKPDCYEIILWQ